jgi:hypothetical protein
MRRKIVRSGRRLGGKSGIIGSRKKCVGYAKMKRGPALRKTGREIRSD